MPNELMQAALGYEAMGYSVIPLKPKDKIPLVLSWTEYQTERANRETIGAWWRQWPKANIGIVTGAISGLFVIDCDSSEAATELKPILGDMAAVGVAATGKGFHLYYRHGQIAFPNRAAIRPHVDFRGDGGYVVAPPSIHPNGKAYHWVRPITGELLQLSAEFIAEMTAPVTANGPRPAFDTAGAISGLPEGQRDDGLFKLACKLRGADVPYDIALELCETAAANCIPPFAFARRKVDQAYKYAPGRSAMPIVPETPLQQAFWPEPVTLAQFFKETVDTTKWLWHQAIPMGSVSMIAGQPRHGKSSFALNLALAIARGNPFCGRETTKAKTWYISIDNPKDEFKSMLDRVGAIGTDDLMVHHGPVPDESTKWMCEMIAAHEVKFVVIDTFERFYSIKKINDGPECKTKMEPLDFAVRELGCHVMYLHHAGKAVHGNLTSLLGSNVIKGMCPWYFELCRIEDSQERVLTSDFRGGKNFDKMFVKLDPATGWAYDAGTYQDAVLESLKPKILEFIKASPGCTEKDLREEIPGRNMMVSYSVRELRKSGIIERTGAGGNKSPFRYSIAALVFDYQKDD